MRSILPLLMILACGSMAQAQDADEAAILRKIQKREDSLQELDRRIQRALDRDNPKEAARLNDEYRDLQREILKLEQDLDRDRSRQDPEPRQDPTYGPGSFSLELLITNFDKDLGIDDGGGLGFGLSLPGMFFQYRLLGGEDQATGADVFVTQFLFGFTEQVELGRRNHYFDLAIAVGLVNFQALDVDDDIPDIIDLPSSDSGPMIAIEPTYTVLLTRSVRFSFGGSFDVVWTDFNRGETHSAWNASVTLALEIKL